MFPLLRLTNVPFLRLAHILGIIYCAAASLLSVVD
jgi:hypothetical protein